MMLKKKIYILNCSYPIEHSQIKDWNDMQKTWKYILRNELRVKHEELILC